MAIGPPLVTRKKAGNSVKESSERIIKVGFSKSPRKVFDEIEQVAAEMVRGGWVLIDTLLEDGLGYAHLFFEREINV
jgi:hypothetical protein